MCYSLPAALIYGCLARYVCIYPTGAGSVSPHLCPRLLRVVFKKRQRCFQHGCFCFLLPLCACSKLGRTSADGGSEVTSGSKAAKCRPEHGQWRFLDKLVGVTFTACSTRVERVEQVVWLWRKVGMEKSLCPRNSGMAGAGEAWLRS